VLELQVLLYILLNQTDCILFTWNHAAFDAYRKSGNVGSFGLFDKSVDKTEEAVKADTATVFQNADEIASLGDPFSFACYQYWCEATIHIGHEAVHAASRVF
jgi:hypothetical protein